MKVIFTIHDYGAAIHVGGGVNSRSFTVEVPAPKQVQDFIEGKTEFQSMSISYEKEEGK